MCRSDRAVPSGGRKPRPQQSHWVRTQSLRVRAGLVWDLDQGPHACVARVVSTVGVAGDVPKISALRGAAPNPVALSTTLRYDLSRRGQVEMTLTDVQGRRVATPVARAEQPAGAHGVEWRGAGDDGQRLPGGVYFARMLVDGRPVGRIERIVLLD